MSSILNQTCDTSNSLFILGWNITVIAEVIKRMSSELRKNFSIIILDKITKE